MAEAPYFFWIVDGTGPFGDDSYASSMKNSFCKQVGEAHGRNALYIRGPSGEGFKVGSKSEEIVDGILCSSAPRIYMAGYSRGGSAVIKAAVELLEKAPDLKIAGMFLFDPVARHISSDYSSVPGNVERVWVAKRDLESGNAQIMIDKYDHSLGFDPAGHNPMRVWFGNTGTDLSKVKTASEKSFLGTHGALGGVGWTHVDEDIKAQNDVAGFMNGGLQACGLPASLTSVNRPSSPDLTAAGEAYNYVNLAPRKAKRWAVEQAGWIGYWLNGRISSGRNGSNYRDRDWSKGK